MAGLWYSYGSRLAVNKVPHLEGEIVRLLTQDSHMSTLENIYVLYFGEVAQRHNIIRDGML